MANQMGNRHLIAISISVRTISENVEVFRTHVRRRHADRYGAALPESRNNVLDNEPGDDFRNAETAAGDAEMMVVDDEDTIENFIFALQRKIALFT